MPSSLPGFNLRMPPELKASADQAAADAGMSTNTWIVRLIESAVAEPAGPARGRRSAGDYRLDVDFALSGPGIDDQAQRLAEQVEAMATLAGATSVTARVARVVPLSG